MIYFWISLFHHIFFAKFHFIVYSWRILLHNVILNYFISYIYLLWRLWGSCPAKGQFLFPTPKWKHGLRSTYSWIHRLHYGVVRNQQGMWWMWLSFSYFMFYRVDRVYYSTLGKKINTTQRRLLNYLIQNTLYYKAFSFLTCVSTNWGGDLAKIPLDFSSIPCYWGWFSL